MKRIIKVSIIIMLFFTGFSVKAFSADYSESIVSFYGFGGIGGIWGGLISDEKKISEISVTYSDGTTKSGSPTFLAYHFGCMFDVTPLRTTISTSNRILAGIRTMYSYNIVDEEIKVGGGNYQEKKWNGEFLTFHSVATGPTVSLLFMDGITSKTVWSLNAFLVGGPIFGGTMNIGAAVKDLDSSLNSTVPKTDFSGWRISTGIGAFLNLDTFDIGGTMYYSKNMINAKKQIIEEISKKSSYNEFTVDLVVGFHI
jgi:hypothetical protein